MNKNYSVSFLLDKKNFWINEKLIIFLKSFKNNKLFKKYTFKISKNSRSIKNQDIVFPLCFTNILSEKFLKTNRMVLIIHPSKLPKNKGFAAVQTEILKGKRKIFVSLIKAEKKVDNGPIILRESFILDGTELYDEIRDKQAKVYFSIIKKFLKIYPNFKLRKQKGKSNFIKKRHPAKSKLNINKSIKEQFNHLRVNSNIDYPSYFIHKKNKYVIKIFKEKIK